MAEILDPNRLSALVTAFLSLFELGGRLWGLGSKLLRGFSSEGMYEVLEFEAVLEIKDPKGLNSVVAKREKVKYLQDNILAYQDEAWGDGKILINYKCAPGIPVDFYRLGHKTHILISLEEVKKKDEEQEFRISWQWKKGFLAPTGFWGASVNHRTKSVNIQVIFPKSRPPRRAWIVESNLKRTRVLGKESLEELPDGRRMIRWSANSPRLYETYLLKWEW